jgi:DNA-binding NarL/FixJ family response regulator
MPSKELSREKVHRFPQPATPFKALIVDRDYMSSELLAGALLRDFHCEAAGNRPSELLKTLDASHTDVVVISADLDSKPGAGFELAEAVCAAHPDMPIAIMIDNPSRETILRAFRCGARGVFNRKGSMSDFRDCVEHVRRGSIWASGEETNVLLEAFKTLPASDGATNSKLAVLTLRELQVVRSAARGNSNRNIASELKLSEHTVKNYLFRAFDKLGVSSRLALLHLVAGGDTGRPSEGASRSQTTSGK